MAGPHLSPRILSAWDQLEQAVRRLQSALEAQKDKVDASEVERLQHQIDGLKEDNLALTQELEVMGEQGDDAADVEALHDQVSSLNEQANSLLSENQNLRQVKDDFAQRLERLIGNVEQILEET